MDYLFPYAFSSLAAVAAYVILGLALPALSRTTGIGRAWMAWVPFANLYLIGLLADVYTDNRLTTDKDRADPFYAPSSLRRRILGYSIGATATGAMTAVASAICVMIGAFGFFMLLGLLVGGGEPAVDLPPYVDVLLLVSGLVAFAAGIFCLVFAIMFLVSWCPALCRVLTAVEVPCPALWTALGVFVPLIPAILLLVYTNRASDPAAAFAPPTAQTDAAHAE